VRQIPLDSYQDKVFQELRATRRQFDVVVGDSQWIGRGATKGSTRSSRSGCRRVPT
jgi:hypothetical protein